MRNRKPQGYAVQPKVGFGTKNNAKSQGYAVQPKVGFGAKNNAKSQGYAVQPKVGFGTKNNAKSQSYAVQSKVVLIFHDASAANPVHATDAPGATTAARSAIPLLRARDAAAAPDINAHAENAKPINAKDAPGSTTAATSAIPLLRARDAAAAPNINVDAESAEPIATTGGNPEADPIADYSWARTQKRTTPGRAQPYEKYPQSVAERRNAIREVGQWLLIDKIIHRPVDIRRTRSPAAGNSREIPELRQRTQRQVAQA